MSNNQKPKADSFTTAIATRAVRRGGQAASQASLDADAAAVASFEQYNSTRASNPFAAAALRAHHGVAIEHGRALVETASAARTELTVIPTAMAAAQMVADRQLYEQHQQLAETNAFAAAAFRLQHADAIERGAKVTIPEPAPQPSPAPAAPDPPPDPEPPPEAA